MCIFLVSTEHPDYPLVILSNRDEYLGRPTLRAQRWPNGVLSPADATPAVPNPNLLEIERLCSGRPRTWISVAENGDFSCVLNVRQPGDPEIAGAAPLSRGWLVPLSLAHELESIDCKRIGAFKLVQGHVSQSSFEARVITNDGQSTPILSSPGTYSVSNEAVDDKPWLKTTMLQKEFQKLLGEPLDIESMFKILSLQDPVKDSSIFVPPKELRNGIYGTRTQTVVLVDKNGAGRYVERSIEDGAWSDVDMAFHVR